MTPQDGAPQTVQHNLTREQAMFALTDLMYGTWDDESPAAEREQRVERVERVAALAA
jgi:hypothetical protein